jgi:hypothetical protein
MFSLAPEYEEWVNKAPITVTVDGEDYTVTYVPHGYATDADRWWEMSPTYTNDCPQFMVEVNGVHIGRCVESRLYLYYEVCGEELAWNRRGGWAGPYIGLTLEEATRRAVQAWLDADA